MRSNTTGDGELRHGYTLASLDNLARKAVLESHWRFLSFHDRYDIAFGAIAEHLYACDEMPRPHDLIRLGEGAIRLYVDEESHWSGRYIYRTGVPEMPRFRLYWWDNSSTTSSSPEDYVVVRTAFDQVWPRLTPVHQRVLLALAAHEDYERAAKSLRLTRNSFVTSSFDFGMIQKRCPGYGDVTVRIAISGAARP